MQLFARIAKRYRQLFPGPDICEKAEFWDRVMDKGIIVIPEEGAVLRVSDQEWRLVHRIRTTDTKNLKLIVQAFLKKEEETRQYNNKQADFLADFNSVLIKLRPSLQRDFPGEENM